MIGDSIVLTVVRLDGDKVRLGISAPKDVNIHREEVYRAILAEVAEITREPLDPNEVILS